MYCLLPSAIISLKAVSSSATTPYAGKYPYDRDGGGFVFCGLTTMASSVPYCPEHHDLCYTPRVPKSLAVPSSLAA
jgi:hypothetical protein